MIWTGTPYYAHIEYNDKKDPADGLPDEDVTAIDEIPVYSINKPQPESLAVLKILNSTKGGRKMMKKGRLIQELEEAGIIDKNASIGAKHSNIEYVCSWYQVVCNLAFCFKWLEQRFAMWNSKLV